MMIMSGASVRATATNSSGATNVRLMSARHKNDPSIRGSRSACTAIKAVCRGRVTHVLSPLARSDLRVKPGQWIEVAFVPAYTMLIEDNT
jgi:hypothetical protein